MGNINDLISENAKNKSMVNLFKWEAEYLAANKRRSKQMNPKKVMQYQLLIAILCALTIIMSSVFIGDKSYADTITFMIIAVWWIPFTFLLEQTSAKCEIKWVRNKLSNLTSRG